MTDDRSDIPPLEPALEEVVAEERGLRRAPTGSRARVLARLDASIGGGLVNASGATGGPVAPTGLRRLAPWAPVATLVVGVAIGAAWSPRAQTVADARSNQDRGTSASAQPSTASSLSEASRDLTKLPMSGGVSDGPSPSNSAAPFPSSAPSASAISAPSVGAGHQARTTTDESELARERVLLEAARTALVRRDAEGARTMLEKHAASHPRGRLSEERDALSVQAAALAGRREEARARARSFETKYPGSLLLPSVRAAITKDEGR